MQHRKATPVRALLRVPIYYKVIIANSAMALTVIATLLMFRTGLVVAVVVVACGITNALLVRAALHVEEHREQQRQLLAWTWKQSENERARVADQLQDDAAQRLAALALRSRGERAIAEEAAAVMKELCDTAETLRPPGIRLLGLKGALTWYARSLENRFGIRARLEVDESVATLDGSLALGLYRILEDILEQTALEGEGDVELTVKRASGTIQLRLQVNRPLSGAEHFRIAERTVLLGGEMKIDNRTDITVMNITIPIEEKSNHVGHDSRLAG